MAIVQQVSHLPRYTREIPLELFKFIIHSEHIASRKSPPTFPTEAVTLDPVQTPEASIHTVHVPHSYRLWYPSLA